MKQAEALTIGIIVLGAIDNWLVAEIIPVPVWVTFIAWASFFILGGGTDGWIRSVASNITGICIASATLLAIELTGDNIYLVSLLVGVGSGCMVQAAKLKLISKLPGIVWGFASLVGTRFLLDVPIISNDPTAHPTLIAIVAMVIGATFGILHEMMANAMTKKESS